MELVIFVWQTFFKVVAIQYTFVINK